MQSQNVAPVGNVTNINLEIRLKIHFIFDPGQKPETNLNFTDYQVPHFMIVLKPYINSLNLSIKMSIFLRNVEPLKVVRCASKGSILSCNSYGFLLEFHYTSLC